MVEEAIVMYMGKVVERAPVRELFYDPKHPYMVALLQSIPKLGRKNRGRLQAISGMVPRPIRHPTGMSVPSPLPQVHAWVWAM